MDEQCSQPERRRSTMCLDRVRHSHSLRRLEFFALLVLGPTSGAGMSASANDASEVIFSQSTIMGDLRMLPFYIVIPGASRVRASWARRRLSTCFDAVSGIGLDGGSGDLAK